MLKSFLQRLGSNFNLDIAVTYSLIIDQLSTMSTEIERELELPRVTTHHANANRTKDLNLLLSEIKRMKLFSEIPARIPLSGKKVKTPLSIPETELRPWVKKVLLRLEKRTNYSTFEQRENYLEGVNLWEETEIEVGAEFEPGVEPELEDFLNDLDEDLLSIEKTRAENEDDEDNDEDEDDEDENQEGENLENGEDERLVDQRHRNPSIPIFPVNQCQPLGPDEIDIEQFFLLKDLMLLIQKKTPHGTLSWPKEK